MDGWQPIPAGGWPGAQAPQGRFSVVLTSLADRRAFVKSRTDKGSGRQRCRGIPTLWVKGSQAGTG